MASIGTLVGFLRLDDAQYHRALRGAAPAARSVAAGITSAFLRVAGPAALAAAVISLGKRALDLADNFEELARRTGATFEGIQVLNQLARNTGQSVDIFVGAIDRLNQKLNEAEAGSFKAYAPIRRLGLTLAAFQNLTAERKLELVARGFAGSADKAKALMAVEDLLGTKSTPQLRDALDQLANSYDRLSDRMTDAGDIMNEQVGKDLAEAQKELEDFGNKVVIITGNILSGIRGLVSRANDATVSAVEAQVERAAVPIRDAVTAAMVAAARAASDQRSVIEAAGGATAGLTAEQQAAAEAAKHHAAAVAAIRAEFEKLDKELDQTREQNRLRAISTETAVARTGAEDLAAEIRKLKNALDEGSISQEAYNRAMQDASAKARPFKTATEEAALEIRDLNRLWKDGLIGATAYSRAFQDILLNLRPIKDPLEQYREELTKLHRLQQDARISAGALALAIRDAARAAGSFKLSQLEEGIAAAGGGRPGGTNTSRSAQRALDKARENAARGNLGAARDNLRRAGELTGGRNLTTLEDLLAPQGVGPISPIAPPTPGKDGASTPADLPTQVADLVKALKTIGDKLTVD